MTQNTDKAKREGSKINSALLGGQVHVRQGDLVLHQFDLEVGNDKARPAVVLSVTSFNKIGEYLFIAPLFSVHGQGREKYNTHMLVKERDIHNPLYMGTRTGDGSYIAVERATWVSKEVVGNHIGKIEGYHRYYHPTIKSILMALL